TFVNRTVEDEAGSISIRRCQERDRRRFGIRSCSTGWRNIKSIRLIVGDWGKCRQNSGVVVLGVLELVLRNAPVRNHDPLPVIADGYAVRKVTDEYAAHHSPGSSVNHSDAVVSVTCDVQIFLIGTQGKARWECELAAVLSAEIGRNGRRV